MKRVLTILLLEDSAADAALVMEELRRASFASQCKRAKSEKDYLSALESNPDVILADYNLPRFNALAALRILQERELEIPFIIVSGAIGEDVAVAALKAGADDYLLKDRLGRLGSAVTHALEQRQLRLEKRQAEQALSEANAELENRVQKRTAEISRLENEAGPARRDRL